MGPSMRTAAVLGVCLALTAGIGGVVGVPDARITIDALDASTTEPVVGERTSVNVTVANSAGSPAAANVTEVRLLDADGETRDVAVGPGALSPGDDLDVALRTRFEDPGERQLTVEVVADEPADDDGDDETVRVRRDFVVDVQPASVAVDVRARALADDELRPDDEGDDIDVGGIDGIIGGGGGGLDTGDDGDRTEPMDSPVAVTVVNTGTVPAERVHVTAAGDAVDDGSLADGTPAVETTPFVVENVAPGEERRVVVDLGPIDRRTNVTLSATYFAANVTGDGADAGDGDDADGANDTDDADDGAATALGAERHTETTLHYPPRDGDPVVTDATVTRIDGGTGDGDGDGIAVVNVDANLGNVGDRAIEGVVVGVGEASGVDPTPAGGEYFIGSVGDGEFVPFELEARANVSSAETVPIRIEYTDRGVRYVETAHVDLGGAGAGDDAGGTLGTLGSAGGLGSSSVTIVFALVGVLGATAAGAVLRRRDV